MREYWCRVNEAPKKEKPPTRKEFMKLPMEERRRLLAEEANDPRVVAYYSEQEKPQTAEQWNREKGIATTGKETPTLGGAGVNPPEIGRLIQQAKAEVAEKFQKAVKDLREGKDIDLTEREFEVFFSIRNNGLAEGYDIGKAEAAREIFEEIESYCNSGQCWLKTESPFNWQTLKDKWLKV